MYNILHIQGYPQEWDCKDDLKLLKYDDYKIKLIDFCLKLNIDFFCKERNKFTVSWNHK